MHLCSIILHCQEWTRLAKYFQLAMIYMYGTRNSFMAKAKSSLQNGIAHQTVCVDYFMLFELLSNLTCNIFLEFATLYK